MDRLASGSEAVFALYGLPGMLWYSVPVFVTAWILARVVGPSLDFHRALQMVLAAAPVLVLARFFLADANQGHSLLSFNVGNVLLWFLAGAVLLFGSRIVAGSVQWMGVLFALMGAAGFFWVDGKAFVNASVWYPAPEDAGEYRKDWESVEPLLFSQAARIDEVVGNMDPRAGRTAAFFVGFAGYGEEKVFAEEIRFAAEVLGRRYQSDGRTLLLLNDARSLERAPLASVSGLRYGLSRIAGRMDLEHDVLVLALSSHGSRSPSLAVSNGVLPLLDLDGEALKAALDDAGIRWRVLVVSACYAGAFIDLLADPHTAIVTAAAHDRTSFGCSNERDLTYFGEAFYRDALPEAGTLREAFERAKSDVMAREQQAGIRPSNPQAFFGAAIEEKLLEYRSSQLARLAGQGG